MYKYFEDKDVHSFNIHTNPDGTTYTVSDVVLIKLFYCTYMHYYEYKKYVKWYYFIWKLFFMTTDVVVRSVFLLVLCYF